MLRKRFFFLEKLWDKNYAPTTTNSGKPSRKSRVPKRFLNAHTMEGRRGAYLPDLDLRVDSIVPPGDLRDVPISMYRYKALLLDGIFADFFFLLFFFRLTYSRWTSSLPSCLWSQRIFPSLPGSRLTIFLSRCKFSTLTTRQPMVEFYLLTFPRFPLRKKEHKSYFGKNRTHDFRTSRCAAYLLDHSGDERLLSRQNASQERRCYW